MDSGLIKDALGFGGSVVMAVPFFRDQVTRKRRQETVDLKFFFTPFAKALGRAEAQDTNKLLASSGFDMGCMLVGLLLLAASFAVSFLAGLRLL